MSILREKFPYLDPTFFLMGFAVFFGWAYALSWGAAYYPTILMNYQVKSSEAVSLDTVLLNFMGYCSYAASVMFQLLNVTIQTELKAMYGTMPVLSMADLFYVVHGVWVVSLLLSQLVAGKELWRFPSHPKHHVHLFTQIVFALLVVLVSYHIFSLNEPQGLLHLVVDLAYVKIGINCVKYIPQVLHNMRRRSMYGSSKLQVALDLFGTVMLLLEFWLKNNQPLILAIQLNRGKLGLAALSVLFDTIFITQFILYSSNQSSEKVMPLYMDSC